MERIRVKLLIDGGAQRVVFAEAGKELVDFLFRLLSMTVAAIAGMVAEDAKVISLTNIHGSIANLNDYLLPDAKEALLKSAPEFSPVAEKASAKKLLYKCGSNYCKCSHIADDERAICPLCRTQMTRIVPYVEAAAAANEGGAVKGLVTYMVADDLTISPMSIDVLKRLNVNNLADLEEKIVFLGKDEAVNLLSASLHSKNVLTDVFLKDSNVRNGGSPSGVKRERTS